MARLHVLAALIVLVTGPEALAQTDFGEPNSSERNAYCRAAQPDCLSVGTQYCQSLPDQPPDCLDEAETQCTKAMTRCVEAQNNPSATPSQPAPQVTASCAALFSGLRQYLRENPANRVAVLWTTNYFAHGYRYTGSTALELRAENRELVGEGQRHRVFVAHTGAETENVSLRVTFAGRMLLSNQYGPYDAICSDNRFAVVHTGDSVESFHFQVPRSDIFDDVTADPPTERVQ